VNIGLFFKKEGTMFKYNVVCKNRMPLKSILISFNASLEIVFLKNQNELVFKVWVHKFILINLK